jgi:hypothetical protein
VLDSAEAPSDPADTITSEPEAPEASGAADLAEITGGEDQAAAASPEGGQTASMSYAAMLSNAKRMLEEVAGAAS